MNNILSAVLTLSIMGGVFGLLLAIASFVFKVEIDPREQAVIDALPGLNCGACGFVGCAECAKAIIEGKAPTSACKVGGKETTAKVNEIMKNK